MKYSLHIPHPDIRLTKQPNLFVYVCKDLSQVAPIRMHIIHWEGRDRDVHEHSKEVIQMTSQQETHLYKQSAANTKAMLLITYPDNPKTALYPTSGMNSAKTETRTKKGH